MTTNPVMSITDEQIAEIEALYSECGAKGRVAIPCSTIESLISRLRAAEMDAAITKAMRDQMLEALVKAQEDINWMINSGQLLNRFVFDYLDTAIDTAMKGEQQ